MNSNKAKVYLIGGGPGDPELLTRKGERVLKEADVIIYDSLSSPNLLNLNPDAEKIYVGKRAGSHYKTQEEINKIILDKAEENMVVARLKGGDPYVFGRGGEEALVLRENNIDFEIVPGISSAIGGLAYAGIPISHRDLARSFHVITARTREDDPLDFESLVKLDGTLVFLMGFGKLEEISNGLIRAGKDPKTPTAVIQWASTSRQRLVKTSLDKIYEKCQKENLGSPAMIVVGNVVSLSDKLNFYEEMPLFGKNIVITREAKRARSTIEKFERLGANVLSFPMIRTEFLPSDKLDEMISNIENYNYIYFTSVNGVNYFMERCLQVSDIRRLANIEFCTIGKKTYRALESYGIKAELMPELFEGMEACKVLKNHVNAKDKVLVPRAKIGRHEIVEELKKYCFVDELHIYDTVCTETGKDEIIKSLENFDSYDLVFTSSSTFENFAKLLGDDLTKILEKGRIISIGPITSKTINDMGYNVDIEAKEYTIDGIIKELVSENE